MYFHLSYLAANYRYQAMVASNRCDNSADCERKSSSSEKEYIVNNNETTKLHLYHMYNGPHVSRPYAHGPFVLVSYNRSPFAQGLRANRLRAHGYESPISLAYKCMITD